MAKTLINDQPTISRKKAAMFFNTGKHRFFKRWDEHYKFVIRHVKTESGLRLLLVDVIEAAFPQATSETIHLIAYTYLEAALQRRYTTAADNKIASDDEGDNGT